MIVHESFSEFLNEAKKASVRGQQIEFWAIFANIYDKYFEKIKSEKELDKVYKKHVKDFTRESDPRFKGAFDYFKDYREKQLRGELEESAMTEDTLKGLFEDFMKNFSK